MKFIFAESRDVTDIRGPLRFGATGLKRLGDSKGLPTLHFPLPVRQPDGSYWVYAVNPKRQAVQRFRTWDGFDYEGGETVLTLGPSSPSGDWLGHSCLVHNSRDNSLLCLAWARNPPGMGVWAYGSSDGLSWRRLRETPLYNDHDSFFVLWHEARQCYVAYQITYQRWQKPFPDNIGPGLRRVLSIRTSPDGIHWDPADNVQGDHLAPESRLFTPDTQDPAELEFYRVVAFPYHDRFVGMALLYASGPELANPRHPWTKHWPQLTGEWWLSNDGLSWQRPLRDVFAPGEANGIVHHAPMRLGNRLLWLYPDGIYGLPEDRLFYAGSLANAEFTTPEFVQPDSHLALNAEFGFHDMPRRGMQGQGYVMVEAQDEKGATLAGFEKEHCIIHEFDSAATRAWQTGRDYARRLHWQGRSLRALAGRRIRLRLFLRDARICTIGNDT